MDSSKLLSLSWDSYEKSVCNGLRLLQQNEEFVDLTLAAEGYHVKAHQVVLALVSPFIKDLIKSANCPHPVIFLNRVSHCTLQSILEYAYTGEVLVTPENLDNFLEACRDLHINGLEDFTIHGNGKDFLKHIELSELSETQLPETPFKTGIKRKRTPKIEVQDIEIHDEYSHDNEMENLYAEIEPYRAGSRWYCRDGNYYVVYRTKGHTSYLRCASERCPVRWLLSKKRGVGPITEVHNHAPTPWVPNRNSMFQALKRRTTTESLPLTVIYEQEASRYEDAASYLPFESVVPSMRKWRKSAQTIATRALQSMG